MIRLAMILATLVGYCPQGSPDLSCYETAMHSHYERAYIERLYQANNLESFDPCELRLDDCADPEMYK